MGRPTTCSLATKCIPTSSFSINGYPPFLFFFSFSSSSSSLHILSNSPTSISSLQKPPFSYSFSQSDSSFSISLTWNSIPFPTSPIFSMASKSKTKKTSYVLFCDAFNLTRRNRVVRLNESPPLTYRSQDHLLANARAGLVRFSNFLIFEFCFDLLFQYVFGYVNAWVLLWDGFRWKPDTLGGVGTCLGWVLIKICLKMSKNTSLFGLMCTQVLACVRSLYSCIHS